MGGQLVPPGPGAPPTILACLKSLYDAVRDLQNPGQPQPLWAHPTAATLEATAPAASFPNCACVVTDISSIAASTLVAGTWTWLRADGSAL